MSEVDVAVVGAGWAGLAAAVELVDAGAVVSLLDAAPRAGGRARAQALQVGGRTVELDNGQHLLVGAYRETLRLVDKVCGDATRVLRRAPMQLVATDGLHLHVAEAERVQLVSQRADIEAARLRLDLDERATFEIDAIVEAAGGDQTQRNDC